MSLLAIDPGNVQSAFVCLNQEGGILDKGILPNLQMLEKIKRNTDEQFLAIEMIASYGMPVGKTVFDTVFWIGRFVQVWSPRKWTRVYRQEVKLHLCLNPRAKDSNIRQALLDRYGPPGTKKNPGKTYGVSKDIWAALAVGVFQLDIKKKAFQ